MAHWLGVRLMKKDRQGQEQENDVIGDARSDVAARTVIRSRSYFARELIIRDPESIIRLLRTSKTKILRYDESYSKFNRCAK